MQGTVINRDLINQQRVLGMENHYINKKLWGVISMHALTSTEFYDKIG